MSRTRRFKLSWPKRRNASNRIIIKRRMSTKKQLAMMPRPLSYSCPDIPVKVRRSLARREAERRRLQGAQAIFFKRPTRLSRLYNKSSSESYVDQVFTSVVKIGQGCFGDVFKACSKDDNQMYAIKVTNDTHSFVDLGEIRRLEKIPEHGNCVRYIRAWQESYRLFIQMELCMTSLDKVLMVNHYVREPQCLDILTDIAQGLKNLHDHRLIHLDIKPANVMISSDGVCKLGDFGLVIDISEINPITRQRERTGVSVSEGDGRYVALEVLRENILTKACDIFSLGLMILEVASDVALPATGSAWEDIRNGILPECYWRRKLSPKFRQLINNMIVSDYTNRPTIKDVLENPAVKKVLMNRRKVARVNYLANWDSMWQQHVINRGRRNLDIPLLQVQGPSPPRRLHPINYVPPSPNRPPLRELELNGSIGAGNEGPVDFPPTPQSAVRQGQGRRISRRLVF